MKIQSKNTKLNTFDSFMKKIFTIPGVKVKRSTFLDELLVKHTDNYDKIGLAIQTTPHEAGFTKATIDMLAKKVINNSAKLSTQKSVVTGIPGGLWAAVTIPADTGQFFMHTLILAQKLAYLYGYDDLWSDDVSYDEARNELLLFLGVMFGVSGSAAAVQYLTTNLAREPIEKLLKEKVFETTVMETLKKVGQKVGYEITEQGVTKGVSSAVPLVGGLVSGGMTFVTLKRMGERLRVTLSEGLEDIEIIQNEDKQSRPVLRKGQNSKIEQDVQIMSISDYLSQLERLVALRVSGDISDEEYHILKKKVIEECS